MVISGPHKLSLHRHPPYATPQSTISKRHIYLSGALGGLGQAFAHTFLSLGCATLALSDIHDVPAAQVLLKSLKRTISDENRQQQVEYFSADVTNMDSVVDSMNKAKRRFGGLDMVVNNAGVADEYNVQRTVNVNLVGVILATEAALRVLTDGSTSNGMELVIVNVASAGGVFPMPISPVYSASKFGVVGYTKSMRNACQKRGVRINCLCPGWVDVGMGKGRVEGEETEFTGVMQAVEVCEAMVEVVRRRDLVGEAVYLSERTGRRIVGHDVGVRLEEARFAKM